MGCCKDAIKIDPGELRHRITIKYKAVGSPPAYDAAGTSLTEATLYSSEPAAIKIKRGTDVSRPGLTTTQLFLEITMRYKSGVLPKMTVINDENGSTYQIQAVENTDERNIKLVLHCIGLASNV